MTDEPPVVAVTGGAGYIGSRLLGELQARHPDWSIRALDDFSHGTVEQVGDVSVERVDIRDRDALEGFLEGADVVAHLAAISGVDDCEDDPDTAYEVNLQGTDNVAWWCRKAGAGLIFPYSMAVIGDPVSFPITADHPRAPLNWYGRTKLANERSIETLAQDGFPAHLFMISNLYGEHTVDDRTVSKNTVINFFVDRALAGEPLTVYEPGTQSRNFVHVRDVARAFADSIERLVDAAAADETGATRYEIATDEDPSVMTVAELVADLAAAERDLDVDVELVENPRAGETLVDEFPVDTTRAREDLSWAPEESIRESVRRLLAD
jgi:UDP-glucose 4-epimerase